MASELNSLPRSKYDLSGYIALGNPVIKQAGNKTYSIQYYQGRHQFEYTIMELQGGIPNGQAQLFDDGIIKMMWNMENGVPSGLLTVFKQGVADRQTTWEFLDNSRETRWIVNEQNRMVMMIIDVRTNNTVYIGSYNSMWMKEGYGIECDNETGNPIVSGYFHDDHIIHTHQRFYVADNNIQLMTEYAGRTDESNEELLSRKPVYVGGYIYDKNEYVFKRHGFGRVINWYSGFCEYEGRWEYGKELRGSRVSLSKGWYNKGVLDDSIRPFLLTPQDRIDMIEEEEQRRNAEREEMESERSKEVKEEGN